MKSKYKDLYLVIPYLIGYLWVFIEEDKDHHGLGVRDQLLSGYRGWAIIGLGILISGIFVTNKYKKVKVLGYFMALVSYVILAALIYQILYPPETAL